MKKIVYLFLFMLVFVACEEILEIEGTNTPEINLEGDWTVNAYIDNSMIFGPFTISTQNTSDSIQNTSDNGVIYIKDNAEFWNFQTKAEIMNLENEFETQSSANEICNVKAKINILNGSIINKDSIAFDIQFEDDETPYAFTYKIKGRRKE